MVPLAASALAARVAPASVVPGSALQALSAHHIAVLIPGSVAAAILPTRAIVGAVGLGDAAAGSSSCAAAGAVLGGAREGRLHLLPSSTAVAPMATAAVVTFNMGGYSASGLSCSLPDGKACAMCAPAPSAAGPHEPKQLNQASSMQLHAWCQGSHSPVPEVRPLPSWPYPCPLLGPDVLPCPVPGRASFTFSPKVLSLP